MKTPTFWKDKNLISTLLLPLGWGYSAATALRMKLHPAQRVKIPVICIGNITAGGTGKTPTAVTIAKLLQKHGKKPFFVSRGYGGTLQGVLLRKDGPFVAKEVGDEPLILAQTAPVAIHPNRFNAALIAMHHGADCIIMDDGFQNPTLYKDISLLVIDGGFGLGNMRPVPSGPLREDLTAGLSRASAVLIIGEDKTDIESKIKSLPIIKAQIQPIMPHIGNKNIIAFAGIGRPEKFYTSLRDCGFKLINAHDFPDHHFYSQNELEKIIKEAKEKGAEIYTTSKDMVKIPPELKHYFKVLEIEIKFADNKIIEILKNAKII